MHFCPHLKFFKLALTREIVKLLRAFGFIQKKTVNFIRYISTKIRLGHIKTNTIYDVI